MRTHSDMALSYRRSVISVLAMLLAVAGVFAYRAGYITPVTLLAENSYPTYPQPVVHDAIHVVGADVASDTANAIRVTATNGANIPAGWGRDGSLLFVSDRIGRPALFAQAPGSDVAHLLTDYAGMTGHARTTPDGSSVLFTVGPSLLSRSHRIMRLALNGGEAADVLSGHFIDGGARCAVAPAMLCAIAERHDNGKHVIFSALNPVSGRGRELARVDGDDFRDLRWDLSPDGTRIAVADATGTQIRIVMIGGPAAERISVSGASGLGPVSFTPNSRGVIVPRVTANAISLLSISLRGDAQVLWEQPEAQQVAGVPSRDGRQVAVWVRTASFDSIP